MQLTNPLTRSYTLTVRGATDKPAYTLTRSYTLTLTYPRFALCTLLRLSDKWDVLVLTQHRVRGATDKATYTLTHSYTLTFLDIHPFFRLSDKWDVIVLAQHGVRGVTDKPAYTHLHTHTHLSTHCTSRYSSLLSPL